MLTNEKIQAIRDMTHCCLV